MDCKLVEGQKVCCIEDIGDSPMSNVGIDKVTKLPEIGKVYTVRDLVDGGELGIYIRLKEIVNISSDKFYEAAFCSTLFKPVVERKTSIEIFQRMLITDKTKEPAL